MKSYCKRVGIPLLILTLLVSVMAPLITLAEDPPPSYETDDWTEFNKLEVADDLHDASQFLSIKYSQGLTFQMCIRDRYVKGAAGRRYRVVNCLGEEIENGIISAPLQEIVVPMSGILFTEE